MSLLKQIQAAQAAAHDIPEEVQAILDKETKSLADSGIVEAARHKGEKIPSFELPNQVGEVKSLDALLKQGPVILTFYRGGWCPYCSLELRAYQAILEDIKAMGASLIAISPELPDSSLSTAEKNGLIFEVLSDVNADYARSIGLVFSLPETLRDLYAGAGLDLETYNGSGQFDLPLAATYLIDQNGIIAHAFVDADYTKREEPQSILEALRNLRAV